MLQRLNHQLPPWAQPDAPSLRYLLGRPQPSTWRRVLQALGLGAVIGLVGLAFVVLQPNIDLGRSLSEQVLNLIFWPIVGVQLGMNVAAMVITSSAITTEKRKDNWDNLRATPGGVDLTLRAHWSAAVFYRLWRLLGLVYLARGVLLALLLYDLTAFRGEYLNYLTGGIVPETPLLLGGLLMALTITASFVLPLTSLGLDASVGLLAATIFRQRVFVGLIQVVLGVMRVSLALGAMVIFVTLTDVTTSLGAPPEAGWAAMLGLGVLGDGGLRFLHAATLGQLWQTIPFGIYIGAALLLAAVVQAGLADLLLRWAVHRAERME